MGAGHPLRQEGKSVPLLPAFLARNIHDPLPNRRATKVLHSGFFSFAFSYLVQAVSLVQAVCVCRQRGSNRDNSHTLPQPTRTFGKTRKTWRHLVTFPKTQSPTPYPCGANTRKEAGVALWLKMTRRRHLESLTLKTLGTGVERRVPVCPAPVCVQREALVSAPVLCLINNYVSVRIPVFTHLLMHVTYKTNKTTNNSINVT